MKVFISNDFEGYWPVGSAAVIIADNEEQARELLNERVRLISGKAHNEFTLIELELYEQCIILCDGNY